MWWQRRVAPDRVMMPRRLRFVTFLFLVLVAGCAPLTPPPVPPTRTATLPPPTATATATPTATPEPTASPTPVPVRLTLVENLPPEQSRALAEEVEAFLSERPGVTIEMRSGREQLDNGKMWHLALADAGQMAALQAHERLQAIDDLLPADLLSNLAAPGRTAAARAGRLWGLADTLGFHLLLFYNRDLIGVPPADTEELTTVARSFTGRERWGLTVSSYDPLWVLPWLAASDSWVTDAEGRPTLDTPAMVKALTLHLGWLRRPKPVAPLTTQSEAHRLFVDGRAAMLIDGDWAIGELNTVTTVNWGVAPLPLVGNSGRAATPLVLGRFWLVHTDLPAGGQAVAAEFLSAVFSPQRQLDWLERFGQLPSHRRALEDPRVLTGPWLRSSALQMQAGRALPLGVDANRVLDAMRAPLQAAVDGEMTPAEAARAMQRAVEE
jgi:ABC-type glycerol-3-phosphate transport system substrate-binding protein